MDVVFDAVGGDTLERSWGVLKPDGRMITIAADSEGTADQRVKDAFYIVEPNQKQLVEIAKQLDAGHLRAFVKTTVPLNEASARTVERSRTKADTQRSSSPFPRNPDDTKEGDRNRLGPINAASPWLTAPVQPYFARKAARRYSSILTPSLQSLGRRNTTPSM